MQVYADIAVQLPGVNGSFSYSLPPELNGRVSPGCLVTVPFGSRTAQGVVLSLSDTRPAMETKPVSGLVDPSPVLYPWQMDLARRMADETLSSLAEIFSLMIPAGLSQHADTLYHLQDGTSPHEEDSQTAIRLIHLLKSRGDLRGRQIDAALTHVDWRQSARSLIKHGLISATGILPPPGVHPKMVKTVRLVCSPEQFSSLDEKLSRNPEVIERRKAVLQFLATEGTPVAVQWVYAQTSATMADLQKLSELDLVLLSETEVWRDPLAEYEFVPDHPPELTGDQKAAFTQLKGLMTAAQGGAPVPPVILHGVTGSGKTEIYLRAVEETLRQGRQVVILVPEIALTPQTVRRFMSRFPGKVGLIHSRLSTGERYDTWRRARAGLLPVIVGPRSALFSPLPQPGLIVVDEFHESSYYQDDFPPYYHAVSAAMAAAKTCQAVCLLGSATPDLALRYRAEREHWPVIHLPERILAHREAVARQAVSAGTTLTVEPGADAAAHDLPPVQLVDMREELKEGNRSMFSRALQTELTHILGAGQQAILFLNRRGTATYIFCRDCGAVVKCPRCDLPLTLHAGDQLVCHRCGYVRKLPQTCPTCGSRSIRAFGAGTETVEAEVQKLFPQSRTLRWDADTTRQKNAHEIILGHFAAHRADILIGTQMLAKGLDLPFVTLVGVILADTTLNLPDYRAPERTFQLLAQVAGRAGRSILGGKVVLQTYHPDQYAIRCAAGHDYAAFYAEEIENRRRLGYPPFNRLARLEFRHQSSDRAEAEARKLAEILQHQLDGNGAAATEMIGPAPCYFARQNGFYRWQIVLRSPDPARFIRNLVLEGWKVQIDPPDLL
jgi:primosomal protein N' (replication factor Y)